MKAPVNIKTDSTFSLILVALWLTINKPNAKLLLQINEELSLRLQGETQTLTIENNEHTTIGGSLKEE